MKRTATYILCSLILVAVTFSLAAQKIIKDKAIGTTLEYEAAKKTLGEMPFDEKKFKSGNDPIRGQMAADLLKKKSHYIGLTVQEVHSRLGPTTGYFWNDTIPAYIINEGWKTNADVWQIVFLPGYRGVVKDIVINKNCCEAK